LNLWDDTVSAGLPPLIPPKADLLFDIEVLGFRARPQWEKKFIQSPGLSETPYWVKPEEAESDYEKYVRGLKEIVKKLENVKKDAEGQMGVSHHGLNVIVVLEAC